MTLVDLLTSVAQQLDEACQHEALDYAIWLLREQERDASPGVGVEPISLAESVAHRAARADLAWEPGR